MAAVKAIPGAWDNTYWVISSDHGYNLGHHRIPSNKFLLYDHATRIPAVIRGPGIRPGDNPVLGTNVDYASTWLAMAGIPNPHTYDGRLILRMQHSGSPAAFSFSWGTVSVSFSWGTVSVSHALS